MKNILPTAIAVGLFMAASNIAAEARDYRFCLVSPGYDFPGDCSYSTYRQCKASASGRLADCYVNPRAIRRQGHRTYR